MKCDIHGTKVGRCEEESDNGMTSWTSNEDMEVVRVDKLLQNTLLKSIKVKIVTHSSPFAFFNLEEKTMISSYFG